MISLRKYLSRDTEQLLNVALQAYQSTLAVIGTTCSRTNPQLGDHIQVRLSALAGRLPEVRRRSEIQQIQEQVEEELEVFGRQSAGYLQEKTAEVKEIILMMTQQADSTAQRDRNYSRRLHDFTGQLQAISGLDDFSELKRVLTQSGAALRICVAEMEEEWTNSLGQLRSQLAHYQTKLDEAEQLALVDQLTGLANRRGLERHVDALFKRKSAFCLAMMDLNGFKKINDTHGHLAGDELLRLFASELLQATASQAMVGRWGGDEFVLLFAFPLEEAKICMDRILDRVEGTYRLEAEGVPIEVCVGASAGLAEQAENDSVRNLVMRADEAMYSQKGLLNATRSPDVLSRG